MPKAINTVYIVVKELLTKGLIRNRLLKYTYSIIFVFTESSQNTILQSDTG